MAVDSNNEAAVSLSVALPEGATRAAGADSALGAIDNGLDMGVYDIRFILEVYDMSGAAPELAKERMVKCGNETTATFNFRLVPGRNYNFVVWADFVLNDSEADLHYNTNVNGLGLRAVAIKDWTAIDESRDAYTESVRVDNYNGTSKIGENGVITLTRPFAKLRVVTNDIKEMISIRPSVVKVNYFSTKFYTAFDALYENPIDQTYNGHTLTVNLAEDFYANENPEKTGVQTLFADYFFAKEGDRVMFTMDVETNHGPAIPQITFNTNIPVNRNNLTTVYGPILTDANNVTVTINPAFENEDNLEDAPYYVEYVEAGTAEDLVAAFDSVEQATGETHIVLTDDIDLEALFTRSTNNLPIVIKNGKTVELDLNGKTISAKETATASTALFQVESNATLTINDAEGGGKVLLIAENDRDWNAYSSVVSVQQAEFVLNGGTIEHLGGTDMAYGIDVLTNGGNGDVKCTINGGTVKSTYRAVRQFLNSDSKMNTLVVNGGVIEGANKSIWMQDASKASNKGTLTVKGGELKGDVYLYVTAGSTEWPVEVSIAESAVNNDVLTGNVPAGYDVYVKEGKWVVEYGVEVNGDNVTILNAGGLKWLAALVNSGNNYFAGKTIKLGADIDLNNEEWAPIGSAYADHGFMGNFDGNGYTIKNLAITNIAADTDGYAYAGLFGVTEGTDKDNQNYIKNLVIENVNIATEGHIVAAAIAYPYYTELENIKVKGNVNIKGGHYTAGVLGYTRRLYNAENISIEATNGSIEGNITVGGVISDIQSNGGAVNYSNFEATGLTIKAVKSVGGISGIICNQTLNGATVKNVVIVSDDALKGTLCGSFDGVSEIKNAVVENVTGADFFIGGLYEGTESTTDSVTINGAEYTYNNGWYVDGNKMVADGVVLKKDGVYYISNKAGMFWFANEVNVNKNAFSGKTVKLTANIDLENAAWTPVGQTGATTFNGVFDGQNYTISNLNVNSEAQTGEYYSSGLFGWVESHTAGHGHIKNVKINGATIVGHHNCGALVGYITQETALVENCHVTGATVSCTKANNDAAGDKAGTLIGNATVATPVKNCTAANSTVSAGRDAGQVIGAGKEANVTGCSATNVAVSANGTGTGANVRNEVIGRLL